MDYFVIFILKVSPWEQTTKWLHSLHWITSHLVSPCYKPRAAPEYLFKRQLWCEGPI